VTGCQVISMILGSFASFECCDCQCCIHRIQS